MEYTLRYLISQGLNAEDAKRRREGEALKLWRESLSSTDPEVDDQFRPKGMVEALEKEKRLRIRAAGRPDSRAGARRAGVHT